MPACGFPTALRASWSSTLAAREVVFGGTQQRGVYVVNAGTNQTTVCVNLLDAAESDTAPRAELQLGEYARVQAASTQVGSRELLARTRRGRAGGTDVRVVVLPQTHGLARRAPPSGRAVRVEPRGGAHAADRGSRV